MLLFLCFVLFCHPLRELRRRNNHRSIQRKHLEFFLSLGLLSTVALDTRIPSLGDLPNGSRNKFKFRFQYFCPVGRISMAGNGVSPMFTEKFDHHAKSNNEKLRFLQKIICPVKLQPSSRSSHKQQPCTFVPHAPTFCSLR